MKSIFKALTMETPRRNKKISVRVSEYERKRFYQVAKEMGLKPSTLWYYLICCYLEAYDKNVFGKFSPIPSSELVKLFHVEEDRETVKEAITIIQRLKEKKCRKHLDKSPLLEEEIKQMFLEMQQDGASKMFEDDIRKRK